MHAFTWLSLTLGYPHHCNLPNILEISNVVCSLHSLGSFGSLGQISFFLAPKPPQCFYVGYFNLFWYVLLLAQSIGTKSAKCIG